MRLRWQLPPYVAVPRNPSFTWELGKSAFLGGRYESFKAGDPNDANYKVRDLTLREPLADARANRRKYLLDAVDQLARRVEGNDQIAAYDQFRKGAASMLLSGEARDAFAIEKEDANSRHAMAAIRSAKAAFRAAVDRGACSSSP